MVGTIGSGSGGYDTASTQQTRSKVADRILKEVDGNQDGKITRDELSAALDARGVKQSSSVSEFFKQLDQGDKGYITKQDIENGLESVAQSAPAQAQPAARPGGGGGGAPPAGGGGTGDSSSASTASSYDPQDLNQDGVVTMQEQLQYVLNLYTAQTEAGSSSQASVYA
jgi:hypothetical protein